MSRDKSAVTTDEVVEVMARAIWGTQPFSFDELEEVSRRGIRGEARAALNAALPLLGIKTLNDYAAECHVRNAKWWHNASGKRLQRNKGELLCLIHSEISEAMEGERKGLMDDKLPYRRMAEVELVDALIRIFDYAAAFGYDLEGAYHEKLAFNADREDHKHEARKQAGGKKW